MPKIGEIKRGAEVGKRETDRGIKMAKQRPNRDLCERISESLITHPNMEITLIDYSPSERLVCIAEKGKVRFEKRCAPHFTFDVLGSYFKD